jgi:hypothetical protein
VISLFRNRDYLGLSILFATIGMLVWYFIAKLTTFDKLGYQSDLFTHLEICRGWLQGRPIMHENCYGYHSQYHNYFFDLLLGFAVKPYGVYGLFSMQFLLYIIALFYTFPILYKHKETLNHKLLVGIFYIVIFCGPYAFWLYDNPHYGFHTEMLYIPLGFVFAVSLYKKQHWVSILFAIFMVSVKEDGAVLVASIHLLFIALQWTAGKITKKRWLLQSLLWGTVWVVVFVVGMIYLKSQTAEGKDRLTEAFTHFSKFTSKEKTGYFTSILISFAFMLLPFVTVLLLMKQINYKVWLWWVVCMVPLIIVNFISGFVYFPAQFFSLTWVPRFSLVFSLFLAMGSFSLLLFSKPWFRPKFVIVVSAIIAGVLLFDWQKNILRSEKGYFFHYTSQDVFAEQHPFEYYPHWKQMGDIAKVLPDMYPVSPPHKLFGTFHKQDIIWTERIYNAWVPPRMIICDETNIANVVPKDLLQNPDSVITDKLWIYFEKEDRHYIEKAGISSTQ